MAGKGLQMNRVTAILAIVFGILILAIPAILHILVGVFLIVFGILFFVRRDQTTGIKRWAPLCFSKIYIDKHQYKRQYVIQQIGVRRKTYVVICKCLYPYCCHCRYCLRHYYPDIPQNNRLPHWCVSHFYRYNVLRTLLKPRALWLTLECLQNTV